MGHNGTRAPRIIDRMKAHPNYKPLVPLAGETLAAFALRWAGHLISPPQEPEESYDLECVDIAMALLGLEDEIEAAWCAYYKIGPAHMLDVSVSTTQALLHPENPAKRKFTELLGVSYLVRLERDNQVQYHQHGIYGPEHYEIQFLKRDGIGDTIIFLTIEYNGATGKWWTGNGVEVREMKYDTFNQAIERYHRLKPRLLKERTRFVNLPTL